MDVLSNARIFPAPPSTHGPSSVCENAESRITDDISSPLSWPSHTRSIYHIITDDDLSSQDSTLPQTVNMETVDISGVKIFVTRLKIFSPLQAVCGGSVEGLVQKNRLSSTSSKDSGHSMDRASTGSEQSQDHE